MTINIFVLKGDLNEIIVVVRFFFLLGILISITNFVISVNPDQTAPKGTV